MKLLSGWVAYFTPPATLRLPSGIGTESAPNFMVPPRTTTLAHVVTSRSSIGHVPQPSKVNGSTSAAPEEPSDPLPEDPDDDSSAIATPAPAMTNVATSATVDITRDLLRLFIFEFL